jgi:hypothetical protein
MLDVVSVDSVVPLVSCSLSIICKRSELFIYINFSFFWCNSLHIKYSEVAVYGKVYS